jgi:hypothetical protein
MTLVEQYIALWLQDDEDASEADYLVLLDKYEAVWHQMTKEEREEVETALKTPSSAPTDLRRIDVPVRVGQTTHPRARVDEQG